MVRLVVAPRGHSTILPARKLSAVSPASSGSTPTTFALRVELLHCRRDAAEQASAGTGDKHQVDVGKLLDNFKAAGGLAGDDLLVVVRRNHDIAVLRAPVPRLWRGARSMPAPTSTTSAPRAIVAARLIAGAFDGITITAFAPTARAA